MQASSRFTHVDPFEDTERDCTWLQVSLGDAVSPTSIRSRILKALFPRSRAMVASGFTHVDPFEDTERTDGPRGAFALAVVSPTSIRSRILKVG